jgi:hypothetical protein
MCYDHPNYPTEKTNEEWKNDVSRAETEQNKMNNEIEDSKITIDESFKEDFVIAQMKNCLENIPVSKRYGLVMKFSHIVLNEVAKLLEAKLKGSNAVQ